MAMFPCIMGSGGGTDELEYLDTITALQQVITITVDPNYAHYLIIVKLSYDSNKSFIGVLTDKEDCCRCVRNNSTGAAISSYGWGGYTATTLGWTKTDNVWSFTCRNAIYFGDVYYKVIPIQY